MPEPPCLLKTTLPHDLNTVQLERYVTVGGNQVRRRIDAPTIGDELDPELALRVYQEFLDICNVSRLHLSTGQLRFEFFRNCLGGQARNHWDAAVSPPDNTTLVHFRETVDRWFTNYLEPTAYHDQQQYLISATKAFSMSVKETASRLKIIKGLMQFMPGSPDNVAEIYPPVAFKMVFYNLMRVNWKANFEASGNEITDPNYTWDNLVSYMSSQERRERLTHRGRGQSNGGRGFSPRGGRRGGRGRGRYGNRGSPYRGGGYHEGSYQGGGYQGRYHQGGYNQGGYGQGGRVSGYSRPQYQQGGSPPQRARYEYNSPQRPAYQSSGRFSPRGGRFDQGRGSNLSRGRGRGRYGSQGRGAPSPVASYAIESEPQPPPEPQREPNSYSLGGDTGSIWTDHNGVDWDDGTFGVFENPDHPEYDGMDPGYEDPEEYAEY